MKIYVFFKVMVFEKLRNQPDDLTESGTLPQSICTKFKSVTQKRFIDWFIIAAQIIKKRWAATGDKRYVGKLRSFRGLEIDLENKDGKLSGKK